MARLSQLMPPLSSSNVLPKAPWELWLSRTAPRPTSANTPPNAMAKRRKLPLLKLPHSSARSLMFKVTKVTSPSSNAESSQDHTFHGPKMARRSTRLISGIYHATVKLKSNFLTHQKLTGNWALTSFWYGTVWFSKAYIMLLRWLLNLFLKIRKNM